MSILTIPDSRRSFLRSASACLALPFLDTFASAREPLSNQKTKMVFLGQGYGFLPEFYPKESGRFSEIGLTEGMSPIKPHQDDISLLGNLLNVGATKPHEGSTTFLTGAVQGGKNSVSCDQLAAEHLCRDTRYAYLTLSTPENKGHGRTISMSWNKTGSPIPGLNTSLELYEKLFSATETKEQVMQRIRTRRSVLDSLEVNAKSISHQIARSDHEKLDEYYQTIRQIELGLKKQLEWADTPKPKAPFGHPETIDGEAEVKLMFDMIALAFQTDQTRVSTYMMPSQSVLSSMGITIPVHALSHYNISEERRENAGYRDKKCMELFGYLLDQLKAKKGLDGQRVYDNCVVAYGTNIRSSHGLKGFPVFLSGGGTKNLRLGESIMLPKDTPLANVWLTLLQQAGLPIKQFSHSTGTLGELLT
jgi:hypothetical protein